MVCCLFWDSITSLLVLFLAFWPLYSNGNWCMIHKIVYILTMSVSDWLTDETESWYAIASKNFHLIPGKNCYSLIGNTDKRITNRILNDGKLLPVWGPEYEILLEVKFDLESWTKRTSVFEIHPLNHSFPSVSSVGKSYLKKHVDKYG